MTAPAILVVGAGDATGGAIARRFAREGFTACVTRRTEEALAPLVERIEEEGGQARGFGCDARDEDQMRALVDTIEAEVGPLEAVVFNIGANVNFPIRETTARVYRNTVADEVAAIEATGADFGQVHHLVSGANQEKAWSTGDIEAGMVTVGMCGGRINDVPSCEELVSNIVSDAEQIISERLASIIAA